MESLAAALRDRVVAKQYVGTVVEMDTTIPEMFVIFLAGISGLYKGIPVGFTLGAHPVLVASLSGLGSITVVCVLHFTGDSVKRKLRNRRTRTAFRKKEEKFRRLMNIYGTVGLGLVASGTIGPIVTVILGLVLLENTSKLVLFLIVGIVIWSVALTSAVALGLEVIVRG